MGRRARGTGGITHVRRKDRRDYWAARYQGKERTARSEREAKARLAELRATPAVPGSAPQGAPSEDETLADFLRRWYVEQVAPAVAETTAANYRGHIETRLIPALGHIPLGELTPAHVQTVIAGYVSGADGWRRYSPSTVRVMRTVLAAALAVAEDWELVTRNAARRARPPRDRAPEPRGPDFADARAILAAFAETRLAVYVTLGALYGRRQSEALGLRWVDVREATRAIMIRGQLQRSTQAYVARTKTGHELELPVTPLLGRALAGQRLRQKEDRLRVGPAWVDSGFVTTRPDGRPYSQSAATHQWRAGLRRAGVPERRFHDLRHGATSLLRELGVDEKTRMAIIGHRSADIHLHYTHTTTAAEQEALARLDRALGG